MAKDPAFLFYYKDILVSCADWDADAIGWYVRLLCHQADKHEGLPNDVESLATLAGVKFSQFNRFVSCWERTLKAKFEITDSGLLINKVQAENLKDRRAYKDRQAKRGLVGYFIKQAAKEITLTDSIKQQLSLQLFECISKENTKEENQKQFKRTLQAYIGNGDVNAIGIDNVIKEKGVQGEKEISEVELQAQKRTCELFSISQISNGRSYLECGHGIIQICKAQKLPYYLQQLEAYFKYKNESKEKKCNLNTWLWGEEWTKRDIHSGHWCREDYALKLANTGQKQEFKQSPLAANLKLLNKS